MLVFGSQIIISLLPPSFTLTTIPVIGANTGVSVLALPFIVVPVFGRLLFS